MQRQVALLGVMAMAIAGAFAGEDDAKAFVRVSPRDPRYLELTNGKPYIPIGLNMIHPGRAGGDEAAGLAQFDAWMKALAAHGANHLRVWLSIGFFDVEHEKAGAYDEAKAKRIDALLALGRKHGIRIKMTLEHFREIDPASPRKTWALNPVQHASRSGPAASTKDWFDTDPPREQFKRKLAWYAHRYGNDPIVYGWELWNEVNCVHGGDYMAWSETMLAELHKLFPRNLAMQSLGSYDGDWARDNYRRLATMKGNDVAQVHRYLDLGAKLEVCHGPVDVLAADAVRELLALKPERPVILAESGAVEPRHTGPFKLYAKDKAGIILHDVLFAPFFAGAAGSGQCWHWDVYVAANDLWWQFGRFAQAVKGLDPPAEGFEPLMLEHPRLRVYALRGKHTLVLWCRDKANTWMSELRDGQAPEEVRGATVDLGPLGALRPVASAFVYDPWANRSTPLIARQAVIELPPFRRSIVVRLSDGR
ncbi:MAG TPA: cellulase family glycosylhydrolase [Planctomycetota bacterium]|nr:cellulase family glycosylhydrolase [Planctomycetota bacterium]HRR80235.1 cellulase family glycosylhydrolase [Planctomycetota bacterium]HRT93117.1 cellulase family glycosylhydrolase [Planctomycetota bacterium]